MSNTALSRLDGKMAISLALASLLAFAIATLLGLGHAYWAPMSVWVVAQPYRDHVLRRGLYRLLGTLIGAAAGAAIVWLDAGPLPSLVLTCLWIGVVGGAQNLWTTASRYLAFMAAMTAAVLVLPYLLADEQHIGIALERVYCVIIGVVAAVVVVGLVTPPSPEWTARRTPGASPAEDAIRHWPPGRAAWSKTLRSGLTAGLGTFLFGLAGILADFRPAELSALGFCIFALILGGLPHPRKVVPLLFGGTMAGIGFAILYRVGVLPFVTSPGAAIVSIIPFILLGALARAYRPLAAPALDANLIFLLIGQATLTATTSLSAVAVDGLSVLIAAACACAIVLSAAPRDPRPA